MERQFENLLREANIRKGLIVYGNTRDEFFNGENYQLLPEYLSGLLKDNGFQVVGRWDNARGLNFSDKVEKSIFASWLKSCGKSEKGIPDDAEDYDLGEKAPKQKEPQDLPPLKEFDEVVASLIKVNGSYDQPCAFIFDWTDFQFGTVQTPMTPEDRRSLEALSILMTGVHGTGRPSNITKRHPFVVILITANLSNIPPVLYQPESRIKLFTLTLPEKASRIKFFEAHLEHLGLTKDAERTRKQTIDLLADTSDGMRLVDLIQIVKLAKKQQDLTPERLFNLYRFGERRSPWEDLSQDKLCNIKNILKMRVIGQDHAIDHVETTIIKASMGLSGIQHSAKLSKPKGVMFFVGPTGVGKTELAKATAEFLFGDENACIRFDMSEYNHEESDQRLIGPPPGYVGFEEGGQLINAVIERPFSVLLFDEIEKAHPKILDKFLQILEDGRLTDGRGVTAYFSETIIIFTSNIGAGDVDVSQDISDVEMQYRHKVKEHFNRTLKRPELLNRIGNNIIVFNSIEDRKFRTDIVKKKLKPLCATVKERFNVSLIIDETVYDYLEEVSETVHGGRGLLNTAETKLINPLSIYLFKNQQFFKNGRSIVVKYANSEIDFDLIEGG
ncbi:AAA family ATPase [Methanocella sp. MCL-LM]|uniref:AAA family ATPase n=1 Tax=Methanocella sp. MCL-LM TaxID=3412035 RepID=UPI003C785C5F